MELEGRTAVITGGASGIGLALARRLARSKVSLVLGDVEAAPLEAAVAQLRAEGATVTGRVGDVRREADVVALREAALAEFGGVHLVVNNAGVGGGPTIGSPTGVWDWVIDVNLRGVVHGVNAFVPHFVAQGEGHVVNTASAAGLGGVPGMGAYCATKFAVVGLSESLYHELALRAPGVHVSVLCPGFVRTRIAESARNMPAELRTASEDAFATGAERLAHEAVAAGIDPVEVADAVARAIEDERFWILTHERLALRTTESRLEWMRGGSPPGFDLLSAARP
ncbi:MAG TPA: SDR family NAD(P)-dependent oxidoreductase [Acidimicrobiales bacterium]|nr:SDR family NAD(P)-dependent oxidoreductase [Acidimicrobiales bacterium]